MEGEVAKPHKFTMDEILKLAPLEERIYRHRCVEAWSIVVPWVGYSFSTLRQGGAADGKRQVRCIQIVLRFAADAAGSEAGIPFPYTEGLRSMKRCIPSRFCV